MNIKFKDLIEEKFENRVLCCATCKWFQSIKNDIIGSTFTCHKYSRCNYTDCEMKRFEFINGEKWIAIYINNYLHWELSDDRKCLEKKYLLEDDLFEI